MITFIVAQFTLASPRSRASNMSCDNGAQICVTPSVVVRFLPLQKKIPDAQTSNICLLRGYLHFMFFFFFVGIVAPPRIPAHPSTPGALTRHERHPTMKLCITGQAGRHKTCPIKPCITMQGVRETPMTHAVSIVVDTLAPPKPEMSRSKFSNAIKKHHGPENKNGPAQPSHIVIRL